jgi:hypothetical protein
MNKEYLALKALEKCNPNGTTKIPPKLFEYKASLCEFLNEEEVEAMINDLKNRGFAEDTMNDRIGCTRNGFIYMDEAYWLEQAYEMVDVGLLKIEKHNDRIELNHIRGIHRIQQEATNLLEENNLVKFMDSSKKHFTICEILRKGRKVLELGGIESYLKETERLKSDQESKYFDNEKLQQEINTLT